jgi:glutamate racemase
VIDPGARAAAHLTRDGVVGMIGTQATVDSGAYERAMALARPEVELHSQACPVFVEHVERGDTTSLELRQAARGYLSPLVTKGIDTLILGCTHYPLLSGLLQMELGPDVVLVSSAEETAKDVYATLLGEGLGRDDDEPPAHEILATGDPGEFQRIAGIFWGHEIAAAYVARAVPVGGGSWS